MQATWKSPTKALTLVAVVLMGFTTQALADVVDYWRFEDGSGSNVLDQTGLANGEFDPPSYPHPPYDYSAGGGDRNGFGWSTNVFNPVVPQTGEANQGSFRFAPGGADLRLTPTAEMNYGSNFTVEFSFNLADFPYLASSGGVFLNFSDSHSSLLIELTPPVLQVGGFPIITNNSLSAQGNDGNGNSFSFSLLVSPDASIWQLGTWHHFALVKNGTNCQLIIDQTLLAESFVPNDFSYAFATNGNYFIGKDSGFSGLPGFMDEVRISNTALDPSQFLDAVPEPSTIALFGMALPFALLLRQNRRTFGAKTISGG
jgi:Concanavalin A-like lectin/glucanases superfamily/PEP-CTERM motif